jgi:Tfp pilus assembly protein PilO
MKRLPSAKRNQLIGVLAGTLGLICAVYFLLILPQNQKIHDLGASIAKANAELNQYQALIKQMDATKANLDDLNRQLNRAEEDVAAGDLYAWTVDTIRRFKTGYHVDIPNIDRPSQGDCDLIGDFPYRQIRFSLSGTAYYHDLGKFIADFENKFTHCRVVDLSVAPAGENPAAAERLNFRMDIVALVKPNN